MNAKSSFFASWKAKGAAALVEPVARRHPCTQAQSPVLRTRSRVRAALLGLATLTTLGPAHGGISLGPGGNGSWGGLSQWAAVGRQISAESQKEWDTSGDTNMIQTILTNNGDGKVSLTNEIGTDTSGALITLSSAANLKVNFVGPDRLMARGWSTAVINDIVTVQASGMSPGGYISFGWNVDGTLHFDMHSISGQPLQSGGGMWLAHMARAESFVSWKHPLTGIVSTSTVQEAGRIDLRRDGTPITDAQNYALDYFNYGANGQVVAPNQFLGPVPTDTYSNTKIVDKKASFSDLIDVPIGQPMEVQLGLMSLYNAAYDLLDFGALDTNLQSNFSHTAELAEVRLFNADGTPYVGDWTLLSANGFDYPELLIATSPVPAPPALWLMLAGLAALMARRRRWLCVSAAAALVGCGGGSPQPVVEETRAPTLSEAAPEGRKTALNVVVHAPTTQVEAFVLLDEVQRAYPSLFGGAAVTQTFGRFVYRHDAGAGNYVAYTANDIFLMGPVVNSPTTPVLYESLDRFCGRPATARFCGFKYKRTVNVDGLDREYIVYVPWRSRNGTNLPLVFMLHGTSGDGEEFYSNSGWRELADSEGFIAVFPSALRHCLLEDDVTVNGVFELNEIRATTKWASGVLGDPLSMPLCTPIQRLLLTPTARAATDHPIADDLRFFDSMVSDLTLNFSVDARRIYASGFSNGGQMTARLAAERSTVFAALASAAGNAYPGLPVAARPMPFVYSVGQLDDRYTVQARVAALPLTDQGATPGFADPFVSTIARPLQLDHTRYVFSTPRLYGTTVATHTFSTSTASPAAGNVLHVSVIAGATHQYPNGVNHSVKMAEVLWRFFAPLTLP